MPFLERFATKSTAGLAVVVAVDRTTVQVGQQRRGNSQKSRVRRDRVDRVGCVGERDAPIGKAV